MRILCVDDEPLMLQMLEAAVREAKPEAEIIGFEYPDELLEDAGQNGCDIAFTVNPKMNIIFVTGFSEYAGDAMKLHASGYIMKPVTAEAVKNELDDLRFPIVPQDDALLRVQCFGNFDVFTPDGKPLHFERSRSKEIFAYLVHRHGSSCTTREIAAALFEDEPYDKKQQSYLQTLIAAMIKSLKKVGAESAIVKSYNALSVNVKALDCDYYRFRELDAGAVNAYQNEYMSQYYWADFLYYD